MTTNELLRRYVAGQSEAAFAELVRQNIALVYSAALRQVNGDVPAAQDVTQAVFTDLARKAPGLVRHTSLTGWLYTSTRFLAAKVRRAEQSRRSREQEAHDMNQLLHSTDPDTTWQDLRPMLDDAMHDLSPADREAVLLRYFERLPLAEIGARLGLTDKAVHMRVERAIDRLRAALAKRGITSTVTALAVVLSTRAMTTVPAGLAAQVSQSALATVAAGGALGWGLLKLAGLMNGKALLAAGAAVLVAGFVVVPKWLSTGTTVRSAPSAAARKEMSARAPSSNDTANAARLTGLKTTNEIALHLIADDTGEPVAGAMIDFFIGVRGQSGTLEPNQMTATSQGVCEIPVSRNTTSLLQIRSHTDGFVDVRLSWSPTLGEKIPQQFTLRLARSAPLGGQVLSEDGQPLPGAQVSIQTRGGPNSENSADSPHISTNGAEKTITDANGRWRIDRFAKANVPTLDFQVTHPDYVTRLMMREFENSEQVQQVLAGTYLSTLEHGITVRGIVVDPAGQPVSGARVVVDSGIPIIPLSETTNQPDGTFTVTGCKAGTNRITAQTQGLVASLHVNLTNNPTQVRLELSPGNLLRLRVVDTNGLPVSNAFVRDNNGLFNQETDADGRITWEGAPERELLFAIRAHGYARASDVQVNADGEEHLITLRAALTVSGSVRDAATSQPVSRFRIVRGDLVARSDATNLYWGLSRNFRDGEFHWVEDLAGDGLQFKFEADGYAPFITRAIGPNEGEVSFDISLQRAVATTITVVLPDGRPATNACIGLEMPGTRLWWVPGGLAPVSMGMYTNVFVTDDAGRFVVPPDDSITHVIAACADGYAEEAPATLAADPVLRMQPWGRIEGTLLSGGKPVSGRGLTIGASTSDGLRVYSFEVETDANGRFAFPKVPPRQFSLFLQELESKFHGFRLIPIPAVTVSPGGTLDLGEILLPKPQ